MSWPELKWLIDGKAEQAVVGKWIFGYVRCKAAFTFGDEEHAVVIMRLCMPELLSVVKIPQAKRDGLCLRIDKRIFGGSGQGC